LCGGTAAQVNDIKRISTEHEQEVQKTAQQRRSPHKEKPEARDTPPEPDEKARLVNITLG
jgi:hypothetical protein